MGGARWTDPLIRNDPGLDRARTAGNALVSMAGTIVVVLLLSRATGAGTRTELAGVVLSTLTAVTGSSALLRAAPRRVLVRTALVWTVASGAATLGLLAAGAGTPVHLVATVAVGFTAVWVGRFKQAAVQLGIVGWLGFLVTGVLSAPLALAQGLALAPVLVLDLALALVWMTVSATLFRPSPVRTLRLSLRSVLAGARAVVVRGDRVLATAGSRGAVRRLVAARVAVTQAVLTADAQLVDDDAAASGARSSLVDAHLAVDELAGSVAALGHRGTPPAVVAAARALLESTADGDGDRAREAAGSLRSAAEGAGHLAGPASTASSAALRLAAFLDGRRQVLDPAVPGSAVRPWSQLPGTAAVVDAGRGRRSGVLASLRPSTRQAVQVAVAVAVTLALVFPLSQHYYFWGLIAAFVVYSGTSSGGETFVKSLQRVVGTIGGLAVGLLITSLFGADLVVVVVVVLVGFPAMLYWRRTSPTLSVSTLSAALPVLYDALHRPLGQTLELRLAETAIGAAVAVVVSLVVLPTRTRDVVRTAEGRFDDALADLLESTAQVLGPQGRAGAGDLDARTRAVDSRLHELSSAAAPTVGTLTVATVAGPARVRLEQRSRAATSARGLASRVRTGWTGTGGDGLARACGDLAAAVRQGLAPTSVVERATAQTSGSPAGTGGEAAGLWQAVRQVGWAYVLLEAEGRQSPEVAELPDGRDDEGRRRRDAHTPSSSTPA